MQSWCKRVERIKEHFVRRGRPAELHEDGTTRAGAA